MILNIQENMQILYHFIEWTCASLDFEIFRSPGTNPPWGGLSGGTSGKARGNGKDTEGRQE
jgi:hypothetical protein